MALFLVSIAAQGSPGMQVLLPFLLVMSAGAFGEGVPLFLLARRKGRAWFRRLSPKRSWYVAAAAWVATGMRVVVLSAFMLWH